MNLLDFPIADLRAISLRLVSDTLARSSIPLHSMGRAFDTDWRGPVVFVGEGHAWALGHLIDIKPYAVAKPVPATSYLWIFRDIQYFAEPISYPCRDPKNEAPGRTSFLRAGRIEPVYARAGLCRDIEAALQVLAAPAVAQPELEPEPQPEPQAEAQAEARPMRLPEITLGPPQQLSLFS